MAGPLLGALLAKLGAKSSRQQPVVIDNFCFRLHYKATFYLLLGLGLFVTGRHYIESPLNCYSPVASMPAVILNNYCWVHGTSSKREVLVVPGGGTTVGRESKQQPAKNSAGKTTGSVESRTDGSTPTDHQEYYQWVSLFLLVQSVFFYAPHWLWRQWEGGYLRHLVDMFGNGYESSCLLPGSYTADYGTGRLAAMEDVAESGILHRQRHLAKSVAFAERRGQVVDYLCQHLGKHSYFGYAYVACEALNFVNACGQFLWTDHFLGGGQFLGYGWRVLTWNEHHQPSAESGQLMDPKLALFPPVSKCLYQKFGNAGNIESHDIICILPLNALNAKVFTLLWFWLVAMMVISAASIAYRFLLILFPYIRWSKKLFRRDSTSSSSITSGVKQFRKASPRLYGADFSDWFVVHYLCKNVFWLDYRELVADMDAALHSPGWPLPTCPPPPEGAPPLLPPNGNCYFEQNINSQSQNIQFNPQRPCNYDGD